MVALIATKYRALYPLMSRVHCIRARDQVTLESKFAVYLHYKKRLAVEFPLLALLFIIYAVALDYFLRLPVASGITFVALCILLPPCLFIEAFYFLVRTTVYFRHF